MATKKECDRCGKQWEFKPSFGRETDLDLACVGFSVPAKQADHRWREEIAEQLELCQNCARALYEFATLKPAELTKSKGLTLGDLT